MIIERSLVVVYKSEPVPVVIQQIGAPGPPGAEAEVDTDAIVAASVAAVGELLEDSPTIELDYVTGASITANLKTLEPVNAGALLAIEIDAYGRVVGTRDASITGTDGRVAVKNGSGVTGKPTIDLDASLIAMLDFIRAVLPDARAASDGSYRMTDDGAYRVTA